MYWTTASSASRPNSCRSLLSPASIPPPMIDWPFTPPLWPDTLRSSSGWSNVWACFSGEDAPLGASLEVDHRLGRGGQGRLNSYVDYLSHRPEPLEHSPQQHQPSLIKQCS